MFCTKCGAPMEEGQRFCSNCGAERENLTPSAPEEPRAAAPAPEMGGTSPVIRPEKPKKKGRAIGWIIAAVAVLAIAALVVFQFGTVRNLAERTFLAPEDYYQRLEKRNVEHLCAAVTANMQAANAIRSAAGDAENIFIEEEINLILNQEALSDEIRDMIEDGLGVDIDWLEKVGFYVSGGKQDELTGLEIIALLNDVEIVGANAVIDGEEDVYISVPALSDRYMKIDAEEMSIASSARPGVIVPFYGEGLPEDLLARILERYADIVIRNLTKVDKGTETLEAGELSAKVTALDVRIDGKTLLRIGKELLDTLHDDRDVEDLICAALEAQGLSSEEVDKAFYDFLDGIEEEQARLEGMKSEDITTDVLMTVYVDNHGKVRGRDIKIRDNKELTNEIQYAMVTSGLRYGLRAQLFTTDAGSYSDSYYWKNTTDFSIDGGGSVSRKKEVNGSFDLRLKTENDWSGETVKADRKLGTIDFTVAAADKVFSYTVDCKPHKDLLNEPIDEADGMPEAVQELLRGLNLHISVTVGEKKLSADLVLRCGKDDLLTISTKGAQIQPYDVSLPTDALDINEWEDSIDFSGISEIIAKLREAGVPASLLDASMAM